MIGTSYEILLYMCHIHDTAEKLGITPQRLRRIRTRISHMNFVESTIEEMLTSVGCRKIRNAFELPAIIRDRSGRIYDEDAYIRLYLKDEAAERLHIERHHTLIALSRGDRMLYSKLKRFVYFRSDKIIEHRKKLDSVWSYEPIGTLPEDLPVRVENIIGFHQEE